VPPFSLIALTTLYWVGAILLIAVAAFVYFRLRKVKK